MAKIAIVEDHQVLRDIYQKKFAAAGYLVVTAATKREGLEAIIRTEPDLILLDLQLPDGNGIEVLKTLRSDEKFKDLPVFIFSNIGWWADEAVEAGATAVISKTTHGPNELLQMVNKVLPPAPVTEKEQLAFTDPDQLAATGPKKSGYPHRFAIYAEKFNAGDLEDSDWRFIESTFQTQVDRYKRYKIEGAQGIAEDRSTDDHRGVQKMNGNTKPVLRRRPV